MLAVPGWMIVKHERVLRDGTLFKFRTAPVDPRDPFRREYVRLDFACESGNWTVEGSEAGGYPAALFATVAVDSEGYAVISALSTKEPSGVDHLTVNAWSDGGNRVQRVSLPFDRYYLEEGDGAKTEKMLNPQWEADTLIQPLPSHALVRILDGEAVIQDLIVGDRSIHEWLTDPMNEQE